MTVPKGARKPVDHLAAEAETLDSDDEFTTADFKGHTLRVKPFFDWDKKAMAAVNNLDFDAWARGALHPDDVPRFLTTAATMRESIAYVKAVTDNAGIDVGELFASQES